MKYYVDYNNGQIKIDVEKEFYQSENLENKITVLLTNVADPEDEVVPAYFLSIEFLRSDGRKCTIQTADAFGEEEDTTLTEDDVTYDIHNFTLTEQVLKCAGTLMFTVYINFVNSDTGKVTRRGVLFNGVNNVKKTVPYSTNSMLVIDDESEAEDNVTNILDELTAINAALATKQKKLVLQSDSGLTMTDSYKLKVKGNGNTGISVETKGVTLNYDNLSWITDFQTLPKSSTGNRTFGLSYYYNTIPVNQAIITEYNGQIGATNSLVEFAVESSSDEDTTTYTYTFSGTTANKIKENLERSVWISQTSSLWSNSAFVDKYGLSFVSSETVCSSLLTRLCRMVKDESLIAEGYFIFKPIARKNNVIYYSCSNFTCTDTESSPRKPRTLSVVLGLVKDGNNFKVEFVEDNTTGKNISASNNTRVNYTSHMITGLEISSAEYSDGQGKKIKILDETNERYLDFGIDYAPTADSEHLVFSGGVKSAIDSAVAALDEAKQDVISPSNKVDADNVDDSESTHKFATAEQLAQIATNASEISKVKSVQNCVDTVATYLALQSYVTTNLDANDKIQVIADEQNGGATTVYNWTGSAWEFVGAYGGNSYTKAQTDALIDAQFLTDAEMETLLSEVFD